jgi:DNA primase
MVLRYDLENLKATVDLVELFEDLVGPVRQEGAGHRAPCPAPDHGGQTGKTPPVKISRDGQSWVWHCHACGAGGSAIDLVKLARGVPEGPAIAELARRTGARARISDDGSPRPPRSRAAERPTAPAIEPIGSPAELDAYVAACEAALHGSDGEPARAWLEERFGTLRIAAANRVGFDPGSRSLARAAGLPSGPGVVFPIHDGAAVRYVQLRRLDATGPKYLNPSTKTWGPNARLAPVRTPEPIDGDVVLVCEGFPDAITVAEHGYPAAAVLGAEVPDADVAHRLVETYPTQALVLAFDGDDAGQRSSRTLAELLQAAGAGPRVYRLDVPEDVAADPKDRDLNTWYQATGAAFAADLGAAIDAAQPAGWRPVLSAADALPAFLDKLERTDERVAIPTGLAGLDHLLAQGGWRPGLVLLAGLPGIGKSAFALQSGLHAAGDNHPVVYVSVEQSEEELLGRLFCRELDRPIADYWNRDPAYVTGARRVAERLHLERLYIRADPYIAGEDHDGTSGRIRSWTAEVAAMTGRVPLVVVDYLQRMRPPEGSRRLDERLRISEAGAALRQLARDLEAPVVVISSIGRGNYEGEPNLGWFKGSGDLEYDADAAIILRRQPDTVSMDAQIRTNGDGHAQAVELHLVKNRYGALTNDGPLPLVFDRRLGSFREPRPHEFLVPR